jgi:hypothetical protein
MLAQFALHGIELVAVMNRRMRRQIPHISVFRGFVGDHDDLADAFCLELTGQLGDAQAAVDRLPAGHRDCIVVENLVGDRHPGGDRLANRQQPRVEVGAVAQVGEDVFLVAERRLADPGHAFAAHVGEGGGAAIHPGDHVVAADAGDGA